MYNIHRQNVTPERIQKIYARRGQSISIDQARQIQQFLYSLAAREVQHFLKL